MRKIKPKINSKLIYIRDISSDLKRLFKAKCAANNVSMRDAYIKFMREYIKRN